ncbi:MAG: hypothetical protein SPL31_08865 [Succinivibrio sp.]|nr:hypothetical protein [Succinivibrio sp.]
MTKFTVPFFYKVEYKPSLRYKHTFFKKVKAECSGEIDEVSKSDLKLALEVRREYALQSLCGSRNYYEYKGKLYTPLSTNVYSEKESYHDTDLWSEIISSEINLQNFFNHSKVDTDLSEDYLRYDCDDLDKSIIVNSNKDEIISAIKTFSKKVLICDNHIYIETIEPIYRAFAENLDVISSDDEELTQEARGINYFNALETEHPILKSLLESKNSKTRIIVYDKNAVHAPKHEELLKGQLAIADDSFKYITIKYFKNMISTLSNDYLKLVSSNSLEHISIIDTLNNFELRSFDLKDYRTSVELTEALLNCVKALSAIYH